MRDLSNQQKDYDASKIPDNDGDDNVDTMLNVDEQGAYIRLCCETEA